MRESPTSRRDQEVTFFQPAVWSDLRTSSSCLLRSWVPPETSSCQVNTKRQEDGWAGGGNSIIWVLIDFLTSLLNFFTRNLWGWNKCGEQECGARGGVFIFIWYNFETDLCSQLLINSSYRGNHQARLQQPVWNLKAEVKAQPSCDMICHSSLLPICHQCFYPWLWPVPPRVVRFAYKLMLVAGYARIVLLFQTLSSLWRQSI